MINQDRVMHMTRMAIFEEEMESMYQPAMRYNKRAYVSMMGLGGFLSGTFLFLLLYGGGFLAYFMLVVKEFDKQKIGLVVIAGVLLYFLYIVVRVYFVRKRAKRRYAQGKFLLGELTSAYATLVAMYNRESKRKANTQDWE